MNNIRAKFEEIWPVPEGVRWMPHCGYAPDIGVDADSVLDDCVELDLRLDTFTRCQEAMFSKEELNLFRQWFNAMEDLSPSYIEKSDCDLYRKVMEALK